MRDRGERELQIKRLRIPFTIHTVDNLGVVCEGSL